MSDKPGILRNLRIKRVALVDMGANFDSLTGDGAHVMLFKSVPSMGQVHVDSPDWDADDMDEYEKADLTAEGRRGLPDSAFAAVWTDAQGKKHRKLPIHDAGHLAAARGRIDEAQMPADVKARARRKIGAATNHKEKNVKKSMFQRFLKAVRITDESTREAELKAIEKAVTDDGDDDDDGAEPVHKADNPMCKCADCMAKRTAKGISAEDVAKAVSDAVAKAMKPLQDANATLQTNLQTEIEKRLDGEMRTELSVIKRVGVDVSKDVTLFRKLKSSDPEAFTRMVELLKGADAQLADSKLYTNIGSGRSGSAGSALAQLEAKADGIMEKSKDSMTPEQAFEKACLDNPKLVAKYREEQQIQ